jgi:hypothetical protein
MYKTKTAPVHTTMPHRYISTLNFCARWNSMVNYRSRPLYPRQKRRYLLNTRPNVPNIRYGLMEETNLLPLLGFELRNFQPVSLVTIFFSFQWLNSPLGAKAASFFEASRSHSDTLQWVTLLWTREQPVAKTST